MNWAILPSCCRTLTAAALLLGLGFWLIPVSGWANALGSTDLDQIRRQYFTPSQPESQIREVGWGGQNYYVIRVATLNIFDEDSRSRTQQRLELLGKSTLLKYLQKSPGVTSANLRYYRTGLLWKEGDYSYGLFYIRQSDVAILRQDKPQPRPLAPQTPEAVVPSAVSKTPIVEPLPGNTPSISPPAPEIELLDPDDLRIALNAEIARLEHHLKAKPDDLPTWETLKELYRQIGDVDNLNRVLDEIIKLKGRINDAP